MTAFFTKIFRFVIAMSSKYNIDSSHDLSHSLSVLSFANKIYEKEVYIFPPLKKQEKVVYTASVLHDMCDKKYLDPEIGKVEIDNLLVSTGMLPIERKAVIDIIDTMSYSKVIRTGFPYHGEYQRAYHVVREADLLAAYDFDRCMLYKMEKNQMGDLDIAFEDAEELFRNRVFKHDINKLLTTNYAKDNHPLLMNDAKIRMESWRNIVARTKKLPK
jgi:HD superfamily phosphodiesterase